MVDETPGALEEIKAAAPTVKAVITVLEVLSVKKQCNHFLF